jgi:hypothetical protein
VDRLARKQPRAGQPGRPASSRGTHHEQLGADGRLGGHGELGPAVRPGQPDGREAAAEQADRGILDRPASVIGHGDDSRLHLADRHGRRVRQVAQCPGRHRVPAKPQIGFYTQGGRVQ